MRVCFSCSLFWLAHIVVLYFANGAEPEESYKPRRWTAAGDGPYRLVVSSESETLAGEESVSLAVAHEKKKEKAGEEELTEKYDKVTQRMVLKRGRKRLEAEARKRRRNPTSTTGPPQTLSYNLYNHFRPLEQDLPRDSILPFLDFGRKLSTPSGANSIEGSSTPRSESPAPEPPDEEPNNTEEMDVTVEQKAVERNKAPRGPVQMKHNVAGFFRKNTTQLLPISSNSTTNSTDSKHKTESNNLHHDLQSNESGIKVQAVLSPNYGLKLNKSENASEEPSTTTNNSTIETAATSTEKHIETSEINLDEPKINNIQNIAGDKANDTEIVEAIVPVPSPKPTARILSTAVVTSVSVKESPWVPRFKSNLTRSDIYQRMSMKNQTADTSNTTYSSNPDNRTIRSDNHTIIAQQNLRRKLYTTLRPKTTTYRPVTFRSAFRRNFTGLGGGVVRVFSTPPTYIEVPKILANSYAKLVSSEPLPTTVSTPEPFSNSSTAMMEKYREIVSSVPQTESSTTSRTTTTPTTTTSTTLSTSTSPQTTPSTTLSTSPSTSTTIGIVTTHTTELAIVSSTSKPPEIEPINDPTAPTELFPTEDNPEVTVVPSNNDDGLPPENATIEIEFKPLDVQSSTTTPETAIRNTTKRPNLPWLYNQRNHSVVRTQSVGVAYTASHVGLVTYVLAGLALIPLILGLSVLGRQIFKKSKKKVLDESEYSSEYNRTPLPTKLPRVPAHINWEGEKQTSQAAPPVSKWEFSRDKLRLQTVLGQGNFGQVWKAEADDLYGHEATTRLVAVKTVKEGSTLREKEDLLRELGIMQELGSHPNVVTLLGCCTEKEPYLLIMEYVMYGKLLAFLREHRTRAHYFNFSDLSSALTSRDLTFFSYCVARGMEYLVTKGIIHRDLAARNILVDHTKHCKIADFGMSRNVRDTGQIYEQRPNRGALPIRWMAPESLHLSLFTHKSDVWSFGILLWEIITLGSTPYNKMGAREVMRQVREGYRLEKPKHCRSEFYKVVSKCWHSDPAKRPSFTDLKQDLANLLADDKTNGEYVDLEALTEEMCDQST